MLYNHFTEELLGLQGVKVTNVEKEDNNIIIYLEMERKSHSCPCCGTDTETIHDYRLQKIKDIPSFGKNVVLKLRKRRYRCPHCGMGIAIYSLNGTDVPSEDILRTCFRNNPDGAGFAFNKDGKVQIVKGFMDFDSFISAFKKYDTKYGFKDRGVLIHFRIATHGGVNVGCCHPFPISSNEKQLKKSLLVSDYAVIHNGIIFLTADKKNSLSDTMIFIKNYLTKISSNRGWFYNKKNTELIYELIDSKMAIINGKGDITATEGFHKGEDGNYYSNTSYKSTYFGLYDDWFYDDLYSSLPLMRLKKNEIVCYEDGKTEEYELGFHNLYPLYLTKEGDVYADYCGCDIGDTIPMEQLTYL